MCSLGGAMRKDNDHKHDQPYQSRRSRIPAQSEAAVIARFVEKVADDGAQRSGKDKCSPK
jgi:hypothetical protein